MLEGRDDNGWLEKCREGNLLSEGWDYALGSDGDKGAVDDVMREERLMDERGRRLEGRVKLRVGEIGRGLAQIRSVACLVRWCGLRC